MSGFWIVSAGWLCARAPNGRQAIRVGCCEVGWFLRGWFLCCLPLQGKQATCAQPPSGASERAQEDDEAPPVFRRAFTGRAARGEVRRSRTQRTSWAGGTRAPS